MKVAPAAIVVVAELLKLPLAHSIAPLKAWLPATVPPAICRLEKVTEPFAVKVPAASCRRPKPVMEEPSLKVLRSTSPGMKRVGSALSEKALPRSCHEGAVL